VDVKGRKFPNLAGGRQSSRAWENWVTQDDIDGLTQWEGIFGAGFQGLLVFAYWLQGPPERSPFADLYFHKRNHYAFMAIPIREYAAAARPRSEKWGTLTMPTREFSQAIRPLDDYL
jgi:hypothetical protein